jgi:hypothetical protein
MNITTVGIDLAKNVFQVHGVDGRGKSVLRKALKRAELVHPDTEWLYVTSHNSIQVISVKP